jgi:hypothetical protein
MKIRKVVGAQFLTGISLSGTYRQSVALIQEDVDPIINGVYRVEGLELHDYGLQICDRGRWFVIPWNQVQRAEFEPVEVLRPEIPTDDAPLPAPAVRVDPVKAQQRR